MTILKQEQHDHRSSGFHSSNIKNRFPNYSDMTEIAERPVSDGESEWVCDIYVIKEKLQLYFIQISF